MELSEFVVKFAELFEDANPADIEESSSFRDIEGWDSLVAMSVIAMVDEEYGVTITGEEIRNSTTVKDVYQAVNSKI